MQKKSNNINFYDYNRVMNLLYLLNEQDSLFFSKTVDKVVKNNDGSYKVLLSSSNDNSEKYVITFDGFDAKVNHTYTSGNNTVSSDLLIIDSYADITRSCNFVVARENTDGTRNYYGKHTPYSKVVEEAGKAYTMKR